jgi:hypothetical protein
MAAPQGAALRSDAPGGRGLNFSLKSSPIVVEVGSAVAHQADPHGSNGCLVAVARWTLVQLDFEAQVLH